MSARPAWLLTHPAAPGLSQPPPSLSLSSQGCPSGPRGLSFWSHSSCPLLSSQTPLPEKQSRKEVVTPSSSAKTKTTVGHPRSPLSPVPQLPGHLAWLMCPRLRAPGAWDKWGSCESGIAGGEKKGKSLLLPLSGWGWHRVTKGVEDPPLGPGMQSDI